jgi:hypothetical protein
MRIRSQTLSAHSNTYCMGGRPPWILPFCLSLSHLPFCTLHAAVFGEEEKEVTQRSLWFVSFTDASSLWTNGFCDRSRSFPRLFVYTFGIVLTKREKSQFRGWHYCCLVSFSILVSENSCPNWHTSWLTEATRGKMVGRKIASNISWKSSSTYFAIHDSKLPLLRTLCNTSNWDSIALVNWQFETTERATSHHSIPNIRGGYNSHFCVVDLIKFWYIIRSSLNIYSYKLRYT